MKRRHIALGVFAALAAGLIGASAGGAAPQPQACGPAPGWRLTGEIGHNGMPMYRNVQHPGMFYYCPSPEEVARAQAAPARVTPVPAVTTHSSAGQSKPLPARR